MLLVIDNYDSFTYNLVQYLGELGAVVEVRRNDEVTIDDIGQMRPNAIVLSPGPCTPAEAGVTVEVIRRWGREIPTLGVCLGHQAITIRTLVFQDGKYNYQAGAGIVADSDPATEHHEVLSKGAVLEAALELAKEGL